MSDLQFLNINIELTARNVHKTVVLFLGYGSNLTSDLLLSVFVCMGGVYVTHDRQLEVMTSGSRTLNEIQRCFSRRLWQKSKKSKKSPRIRSDIHKQYNPQPRPEGNAGHTETV